MMLDGRVMLMGGVGTVFPLQFLVQGGANESDPLASAEIYDPSTGTVSPAATIIHSHIDHAATMLPDGRVLVAAGLQVGIYAGEGGDIQSRNGGMVSDRPDFSYAVYIQRLSLATAG